MKRKNVVIFTSMFSLTAFSIMLINHDMYFYISKTKLYLYMLIAFIFLIHNALMLAKEMSTKYLVVMDKKLKEKLEKNKRSDEI